MPSRNRKLDTALGIVAVITLAIGIGTLPHSPTTQQFRYDNPYNENYRPGGSECEPATLARIASTKVRLSKTEDCQKQAEEYRQNSDDLTQQTRAANAAQAQADIASQQLWTGWLQTLGGFLTLAAAVGAAIYARDAAKHTREGNEITQQAQRAWVTVDIKPSRIAPARGKGLEVKFDLLVQNIGDTIASHFDVEARVFTKKAGEDIFPFIDRTDEQVRLWAVGHQAGDHSSLLPKDRQSIPMQEILAPKTVKWSKSADWEVPSTQIVVVCAVLYKIETRPTHVQVSTRSWYFGMRSGQASEKFRFEQGLTIEGDNIAYEPFHLTLSHREYPAPDDT